MRTVPRGTALEEVPFITPRARLIANAFVMADVSVAGLATIPQPPLPPARTISGALCRDCLGRISASASITGRGPETFHPAFPFPGPNASAIAYANVYASSLSGLYKTSTFCGGLPLRDSTNSAWSKLVYRGLRWSAQTRPWEAARLASSNFPTSYSWMALWASSSCCPHLHSPTTPTITKIIPSLLNTFTHVGWSGLARNFLGWSFGLSDINSESSFSCAHSLRLRRILFTHAIPSWIGSNNSSMTPIATTPVAKLTRCEASFIALCNPSLVASDESQYSASRYLDNLLKYIGIGRLRALNVTQLRELDKTLVIQDNDKPLAVLLKYEHFIAMQEKMPDEE